MHYAKRPSPFTYAAAGGILSIGVVNLAARAIDNFTAFNLAPPLDSIAFTLSVIGIIGGGAFSTWLIVRTNRHTIAALRSENVRLHDVCDKLDALLQAVEGADQQAEINGIRINKVLEILREHEKTVMDADTQPLGRLRSINGGNSA